MRSYLILGMCGLFLVQYFIPYQWLQYIVVIMALLAFLCSTTKADRFPRWLGLTMMGTGILLELSKGTGFAGISEGVLFILPVLSLVILAPLLSLPLKVGGYFEAVSVMLRNLLNQPRKLYAGITLSLFLLSPILNLGSVRIINEFLEDIKLPSFMYAKGYLVGFSTAVMWSPYFASVSLVLHYLKIPFKDYILYGIGLSLLSLLVGNILFAIWERRNPFMSSSESAVPFYPAHRKQLIKLVFFIVLIVAACLLAENYTHWSMVVIVCLVSIMVPLLWGAFTNGWIHLKKPFADFRDRSVPMMNNEIMLFMSAGLLGYASQGTSAANGISSFLTGLANQSFFLFALSLMVIVLGITYLGVHQIAAVGAIAMQLNAEQLGISSLALAMTLLLTWSISTALSPFSGLNLLVSRFSGITGGHIALRTNGLHLSILAIIGLMVISIIV